MILRIVLLGVGAAVLSVLLREQKSGAAALVAIAFGVAVLLMLQGEIAAVVAAVRGYAGRLPADNGSIALLLKIIAVAYLTQWGASLCEDAGERSIAMKVELAGRIAILAMTAPVLLTILNLILGILP